MLRLLVLLLLSLPLFAQSQPDSITFIIHANNLSEDKNLLATGDDEIIFQLYAVNGAEILGEPLVHKRMEFDEDNRVKELAVPVQGLDPSNSYFVYLTEYEYDKSYQQRTPIYRIYHKEINELYSQGKDLELRQYLDSDDLLGFKQLTYEELTSETTFEFEGIQNLEKFNYKIGIKVN